MEKKKRGGNRRRKKERMRAFRVSVKNVNEMCEMLFFKSSVKMIDSDSGVDAESLESTPERLRGSFFIFQFSTGETTLNFFPKIFKLFFLHKCDDFKHVFTSSERFN